MSTAPEVATSESTEPQPATIEEILVDPFSGDVIDLSSVEDNGVIDLLAEAIADRDAVTARFSTLLLNGKRILEQRMRARGARAIPHLEYVVELEDEFVPNPPDLNALREAQKHLPDDEAAKVIKHIPRFTPDPVPARDEPGHPSSIAALRRKYAGTIVDELLEKGFSKAFVGTKFVFKRRPQTKNVTPKAIES